MAKIGGTSGIGTGPTLPPSGSPGQSFVVAPDGVAASQDWRLLPDGVPTGLGSFLAPEDIEPVSNGYGTSIPILDISDVQPASASPTVVDGVLRAPTVASAKTVVIPAYVTGAPTTPQFASVVGFADTLGAGDTEVVDMGAAGVNITITDATGSGPICHFVPEANGDDIVVTMVKVGLDYQGAAYISDPILLDRRLGHGDRGALVVDTVTRSWHVEVNGEPVAGATASLVVDGAGEDVIVDGVTVTTIDTPFDFSTIASSSTPSGNNPSDWRAGTYWWAFTDGSDFDPDALGVWVWDGEWVQVSDRAAALSAADVARLVARVAALEAEVFP